MGSLHWLILVPYYFFGAIGLLLALVLSCRLVRVKVPLNGLVITAITLGLLAVAVPLITGWGALSAYNGRRMLGLAALSLLIALVDTALARYLPLPLDRELHDL